jgi:hypothetical protein
VSAEKQWTIWLSKAWLRPAIDGSLFVSIRRITTRASIVAPRHRGGNLILLARTVAHEQSGNAKRQQVSMAD